MALLLTLFIPLVTAIVLSLVPAEKPRVHRMIALAGSLVAFVTTLILWFEYDPANPAFQALTNVPWIASLDIGFRLGIDGMSLLLVALTTLIMPIAIASSFESIRDREKLYYIMLLVLEFGVIGVFTALDTFLFYVFWEIVLIPMYFLIGIWGGRERIYASMKFFIYTMAGSLLMLVAIIWLSHYAEITTGAFTGDMQKLMHIAPKVALESQRWLFLAFAISFCIKVPLFPLHTWLPDAHTQAPTAGSIVLAAVMLKMGTYGLVRFNLQLFPQASLYYADLIAILSVIGIIYGALVAMVQTDIKKLVAYSSVAHLGFVTLGIFSMTAEGLQGAVLQMVNHGLSTGMLFLLVGFLYERRHTREMSEFGGIAHSMPVYAVFFALAMLASVGLPGLNGFVGEYLTLIGAYMSQHLGSRWYAVVGASGVILAAVYLLLLYQRIFFGPITRAENAKLHDLTPLEIATVVPLTILFFWIGFHPSTFLGISEISSRAVVGVVEQMKGIDRYAADARARLGDTATVRPAGLGPGQTDLPAGGPPGLMPSGAMPPGGMPPGGMPPGAMPPGAAPVAPMPQGAPPPAGPAPGTR